MVAEKIKGVIVAVQSKQQTDDNFLSSLLELERLADTAGISILEKVVQKREHPEPATYIGKGKISDIATIVSENQVDIIIFNDMLNPIQLRNLEAQLDVRVIDRTQVILDIFASRAHTRESKIQVELAQYQYLLPRLAGIGKQLSRLGGGIGTRGPGETKLETDRRRIRDRIADLRSQLEQVKKQRELQYKRRKKEGVIQVILTGYTNAGKSSLLNRLTNAGVLEEDRLFATLDPTMRKKILPSGIPIVLVDTVGFIQDLPTQLVAAFRSTLEVVKEADLILHVIDNSDSEYQKKMIVVEDLLRELGAIDIPRIDVFNKQDLHIDPIHKPISTKESIRISTYSSTDLEKLLALIDALIQSQYQKVLQKIPFTQPELKAKLYANSLILNEFMNYDEGVWEIESLQSQL